MAKADIFLKLDPVKGESQDKTHKDEIEVLSFSWGLTQAGTAHQGTGSGSGKVHVHDLSFTHHVDKASTFLIQAIATGKHFDKGILTVRKPTGDDPLEYLKITLEKVYVSGIQLGGHGGEHQQSENVTLNFAKFKVQYVQQMPDGKPGSKPEFGWDIPGGAETK